MTADMKLKIIIKKEATILATLYDLYCPYNPIIISPHIYYLNPQFAKILYTKYLLEKENAWNKTFKDILEGRESNIIKILKSIEIYNWNIIKKNLAKKSKEIIQQTMKKSKTSKIIVRRFSDSKSTSKKYI